MVSLRMYLVLFEVQAALFSGGACAWLLVKLHSDAAGFRNRLFPTQLRYLAFADLCFVLCMLPVVLTEWNVLGFSAEVLAGVCKWNKILLTFWRHVSLWIEVHLAVSFVFQSMRMQCPRFMYVGLPVVYVPCLSLTLVSVFVFPWDYDYRHGVCRPARQLPIGDPLSVADNALCLCVCLGCYITVVCRSQRQQSPHSVQLRVWARTEMYIFNALVSYGPMLLMYVHPILFERDILNAVGAALELYSGFLNTVTYALQSRYARVLTGQDSSLRQEMRAFPGRISYCVDVCNGPTSVVEVPGRESL